MTVLLTLRKHLRVEQLQFSICGTTTLFFRPSSIVVIGSPCTMKSSLFSGSYAGLLAMLLCLLSAVEFCSSSPLQSKYAKSLATIPEILSVANLYNSRVIVRRETQLFGRKPSQTIEEFKEKQQRSTSVPTNKEAFMDFTTPGEHLLSSDGFEGCVGILIASNRGVILGHYTQTMDNVKTGNEKIKKLYEDNLASVQGATPIVYAQVSVASQNVYNEPEVVQGHIDWLKTLTGKTPNVQRYVEPMEIFLDQDGLPLDDVDYDNIQYGAMLAENQGGGSSPTNLILIDIDTQTLGATPNTK